MTATVIIIEQKIQEKKKPNKQKTELSSWVKYCCLKSFHSGYISLSCHQAPVGFFLPPLSLFSYKLGGRQPASCGTLREWCLDWNAPVVVVVSRRAGSGRWMAGCSWGWYGDQIKSEKTISEIQQCIPKVHTQRTDIWEAAANLDKQTRLWHMSQDVVSLRA